MATLLEHNYTVPTSAVHCRSRVGEQQPSLYLQQSGKHVDAFNPQSFWGAQSFTIAQKHVSITFSTLWISVQITNKCYANISKTFVSTCKL